MSRPSGSPNIKPTRQEIAGYYRLLRNAAQNGDTQAAGELLRLDAELSRFERMQAVQSREGSGREVR